MGLDLLVQDAADLALFGLPVPTRFDLDARNRVTLPWTPEFFDCWRDRDHPRIGSLTEPYMRELAWLMARRTMPGRR